MEQVRISEIKEFNSTYVQIVNNLLTQLTPSPIPFTDEDLKEIISLPNNHLFLLFYEGEAAGMLSVGSYKTPTGSKHWIEDVVVDDKFRGKSLGKKLIEHAIHYVSRLGHSSLMLTSNPTRIAANKLYQAVGFRHKETNVYKMDFEEN